MLVKVPTLVTRFEFLLYRQLLTNEIPTLHNEWFTSTAFVLGTVKKKININNSMDKPET